MPLRALQRLVAAAAGAGLIAGLLLTAMQLYATVPLIRAAEAYETAHEAPPALFATALANVALAIGFGLFIAAGMSLRSAGGWRAGLLWGAAGYVVFFVAPSLGLPPELPGADAAPLMDRQVWWLATVACSAAGLAMIVFARGNVLRAIGVVLLVIPHAIGTPQLAAHASALPADLVAAFARATYLCNAAFWLVLGAFTGLFAAPERFSADCNRTSNSTV